MLKKYIDHHVHTSFSPDSFEPMEEYILKAKELGLSTLMFTDHVDYGSPDSIFDTNPDYYAYQKKLKELESEYSIRLLMGVELGYIPRTRDRNDALLNAHQFDFVILSIHYLDDLDFSNGDFFINKTPYEAYQRYYEAALDTVTNYANFDVFGHLDFIVRYGDREVYKYDDYKEIIDKILKTLISKNKGLDLNTSGYRYDLNDFHPAKEILRRYKELGGEIITLGSDAHKKEDIQANFKEAIETLKSLGYTHVTHFEKRKPYQIKI